MLACWQGRQGPEDSGAAAKPPGRWSQALGLVPGCWWAAGSSSLAVGPWVPRPHFRSLLAWGMVRGWAGSVFLTQVGLGYPEVAFTCLWAGQPGGRLVLGRGLAGAAGCGFHASDISPLVSSPCVGSMEEGPAPAHWPGLGPWLGRAMSGSSCGPSGLWTACLLTGVPMSLHSWLFVHLAQHWHLWVIGWAGLGANKLQQVRRTWPRTTVSGVGT